MNKGLLQFRGEKKLEDEDTLSRASFHFSGTAGEAERRRPQGMDALQSAGRPGSC